MNFKEFLQNNIVYLDGGMGTLLQSAGLKPGEKPELWNIANPDAIVKIHKDYFDAGSNVVSTNTFGANILKFDQDQLDQIVKCAVANAKTARDSSKNQAPKFIALDIGPTGKLLKPLGDLDFEDAVSVFSKTVKLGVKYGVDLIIIETMNDCYETKAAVLAAKENSNLPIIVTNAYGEDKKLMTGATPLSMVAMLEGLGVDAIGANCSLGPKQLSGVIKELLKYASVPVVLKPNAGLPRVESGKTVYDVDAVEFSKVIFTLVEQGVRVVGGCCGTTPEYIKALFETTSCLSPKPITHKNDTVVSSYTHAVTFEKPVLIGERINPTGKKRFKQALLENDIDYILSEGVSQQEKGVHLLDVNVGLPDIDEANMLVSTVKELQAVVDLPLQIDTADTVAMEKALRVYNGKAMINSVNGKKESMSAIFPLVKKYGGVVVALTLDENGIPETFEKRVAIAKNILKTANQYGIDKKDIVFDPLAMTISADNNAAVTTLNALRVIKNELECHTVLGVSNVSFGLPCRDVVNSTFFALALQNGLSAAIMNPFSVEMQKAYYSFCALSGQDLNCQCYIDASSEFAIEPVACQNAKQNQLQYSSDLQYSIIKGLKDKACEITKQLLTTDAPLDVVNNHIIPALDTVGIGFENKTVYLPQLLMSAEAAKSAFEVIKSSMLPLESQQDGPCMILATVKGDVHDIGKNIVKLLLENYGVKVIDLGKDVEPQIVVDKAIEYNAAFVGLSALMTTTVPSMEQTIRLLNKQMPSCKTIVGGAVLTKEYAERIGADKYCKDAMECVHFIKNID